KPERRNRRRVEQGVNAVVHNRSQDSREPGGEQISRGGADALVRLREPELCALVRAAPRLKGVVRRWNVPDAHASADFAPEEIVAEPLVQARSTPAERIDPPNGLIDERGEHVQKIVIRDVEVAMCPVHPLEGFLAAPALVPPLAHLGDEKRRVVISLLGARVKLAGPIQQRGDAGHTVGAVQRDFQRTDCVPRKVVTERQVNDSLTIALWIEPFDLPQNVESTWHPAHPTLWRCFERQSRSSCCQRLPQRRPTRPHAPLGNGDNSTSTRSSTS